ncbi:PaaI family thioesterase [Rhodovulum strictum]|uniref:Hotdog fold thioesterase n=1 Tax=Rhodovulum strictum TaxID=58314 RepID=A0A844BGM6_9RHOB|nr:PaaI family thioesterase [Rhodovulum strictum]MRH20123.1 hotdog fold thioesterase [Rhodovulum strictum]
MSHAPRNPDYAETVRASFALQAMMRTIGAEIVALAPGLVEIAAPIRPEFGQQQGMAHAGLTFSLGDSAAGYAALSLMAPGQEVVTSEMTIHLLAPATGTRLIARGEVVRAGKRLMVARADVHAEQDGTRCHVATLLGTMVPVSA